MENTWDILCKELAYQGFRVKGKLCQFFDYEGNVKTTSIEKAISILNEDIHENNRLMSETLEQIGNTLISECGVPGVPLSPNEIRLFKYSLKMFAKFIECFNDLNNSKIGKVVSDALEKDITQFSSSQMKNFTDLKIAVDWIFRLVSKLSYQQRLLKFYILGKDKVNMIKVAKGISGPWANLDLPMLERAWKWEEEDANLRGRDRDIRKQRRYRKGLENYNNDGRVGEGHYWREIRNEPYSWYSRSTESPYPGRNTLTQY